MPRLVKLLPFAEKPFKKHNFLKRAFIIFVAGAGILAQHNII
jgi:hypothetical protein